MASILLDSIINDTVHSFREHDLINDALMPSKLTSDQIDNLLQQPEMGQRERLFWIVLFSLMALVAAGGNVIVIYIVSTNKEMKSVTNYFLVNLSLADTMVSTLNVIFNFISMLNSHWPFGDVYCKISNFIAILSISASVFTLTAISCDRYDAILHPLRPRMSHGHALAWILLIWTLSAVLAAPNMIYSVVVENRLTEENLALTCTMVWPDGRYPLSSYDHIYNIVILVSTYLVPILTMAILYYQVGKELWGYEAIGENVAKQQARALLAKKKIVKMMIVVVIVFALCWLPYHGFFVINYYLPIFQDEPLLYQRCYLFMYWLAMSNSMYNPIVIYFMNSKFRHEIRRVIVFVCCCGTQTAFPKKGSLSLAQSQSLRQAQRIAQGTGSRLSIGSAALAHRAAARLAGTISRPQTGIATANHADSEAASQLEQTANSKPTAGANQHRPRLDARPVPSVAPDLLKLEMELVLATGGRHQDARLPNGGRPQVALPLSDGREAAGATESPRMIDTTKVWIHSRAEL